MALNMDRTERNKSKQKAKAFHDLRELKKQEVVCEQPSVKYVVTFSIPVDPTKLDFIQELLIAANAIGTCGLTVDNMEVIYPPEIQKQV